MTQGLREMKRTHLFFFFCGTLILKLLTADCKKASAAGFWCVVCWTAGRYDFNKLGRHLKLPPKHLSEDFMQQHQQTSLRSTTPAFKAFPNWASSTYFCGSFSLLHEIQVVHQSSTFTPCKKHSDLTPGCIASTPVDFLSSFYCIYCNMIYTRTPLNSWHWHFISVLCIFPILICIILCIFCIKV